MNIYVQVLIDIIFVLLCTKFLTSTLKNFNGIFNSREKLYEINKSNRQKIYIIVDVIFIVISFVLFYLIMKNLILPMYLNTNPYKSVLSTPFYLFSNTIRVAALLTIVISSISELFVKERIDKNGVFLKGGLIEWENITGYKKTAKDTIILEVSHKYGINNKANHKRITCRESDIDIVCSYLKEYIK